MMIIENVTVLGAEGDTIALDGDRIAAVGPRATIDAADDAERLDGGGALASPGFIDIQFNGAYGHDLTADPSSLWDVAAEIVRHGVTSFLPTVITAPDEAYGSAIEVLRRGPPNGFRGARPLGWHFEGPFLAPQKRGAHNEAWLQVPGALADGWSRESGVRLVTLAPELPGALELITALVARGVVVSCGHSSATRDQTLAAIEHGATCGTHLFNAMPPLHHREPSLPGVLLTDERIAFGLISDGIHVHPAMMDLAWRSAGPDRIILVTDAMAAAGHAPGRYVLGDLEVIVDDTSARLPDGTLAGSILSLDEAVRIFERATGAPLERVLGCVTTNPARLLGDAIPTIAPGAPADIVLLDPATRKVRATVVAGATVWREDADDVTA